MPTGSRPSSHFRPDLTHPDPELVVLPPQLTTLAPVAENLPEGQPPYLPERPPVSIQPDNLDAVRPVMRSRVLVWKKRSMEPVVPKLRDVVANRLGRCFGTRILAA
jgi:hypothetical protein